ncbi:hypothetical protein Ciccas_002522 [Cichlidogyrus casuarinus]|uniref:Dynein light intermediate chain n=1 Tax=Cichlidogyrus casuarinus TaxID=1844966 RepID=A0ABD2QHZ0_9PLAT
MLLVLGDSDSGKTTLVAALNEAQHFPKCYGMEFRLMEIKDTFRGDKTDLGIYIMDGDPTFLSLLKVALTPDTFPDFTVVIALSMAKPWCLLERLKFWLDKLEELIQSLEISPEDMEIYKRELAKRFAEFTEEDDFSNKSPLTKNMPTNPASEMLMTTSFKKEDSKESTITLPQNALIKNFGVPIIVVVTKTDSMGSNCKENQLMDEQFDFIQMHLRRACLNYGAALIYTSIKEKKNQFLLKSYIQHRIYGFSFSHKAYVVERDSIFIPAGWDSEQKISLLEGTLMKIKPNDNYAEVVPVQKPKNAPISEPELVAPDHQQFLAKLFQTMQREQTASPNGNADSSVLLSNQSGNLATSLLGKVTPAQNRSRGSISAQGTPGRRATITPGGVPGQQTTNDTVLTNFFENLLNKSISPQQNQKNSAAAGKNAEEKSQTSNLSVETVDVNSTSTPLKKP